MDISRLGWNLFTVILVCMVLFALVSAWGLWQQSQKIWKNKSVESISVFWFSYNIFLFFVGVIYGVYMKSFAMIFSSCLLGLMHLPILIGLNKFKPFNEIQRAMFILYFALLVMMSALPQKEFFYLFFSFVNIVVMAFQPWEIFKKKNSGMVEIKVQVIYFFSSCFWLAYSIMMDAWAMEIVIPFYLVLLSATMILWKKYQVKPANGSS